MHNWLPDAHSQAPAPVSALFLQDSCSVVLRDALRADRSGHGKRRWALKLLIGFGLFSILVAAAFIVFQHDLKRLLAYHIV